MRWLVGMLFAATVCACATTDSAAPVNLSLQTEAPSWPTLSRFSGEDEFNAYLGDVRRAAANYYRRGTKQTTAEPEAECPPEDPSCLQDQNESIVVTGSRISRPAQSAATSITNVQNAGVDEGDIVKYYHGYLIVLQDGRLFTVRTGDTAEDLRLIDRADVYRHAGADVWYDEMLISDNRIVVTGYNYGEDATEFSVFSIDNWGRLTREGAYFLSSDDYYDTENYATRLVNGNLVVYTPLDISALSGDERPKFPLVRRWLREDEYEDNVLSAGRNLFDARDIYRPLRSTLNPVVHTVSVCPLGEEIAGDELDCSSTAVISDDRREFYVSNDHIYLWTWPGYDWSANQVSGDCDAAAMATGAPATLYQISLTGGPPRARFIQGRPYDQLSMDANASTFRALSVWVDDRCGDYPDDVPLRYLSVDLDEFARTPQMAAASQFTPLPSTGGQGLENRFTDTYLVYGGRERYSSYPPDDGEPVTARVVAVPTNNPRAATVLQSTHNILRVERVGNNTAITGYRDNSGLNVSLIDLAATPRISSTVLLANRYESEGRSHAFNSAVEQSGEGVMGLPTVLREGESGRWWWRSRSSDVSFLTVDADGKLTSVGALIANPDAADSAYTCEVSCIDWYGNSRPIFIAGRVFALSGTELIEGAITAGQIEEKGRVNLTRPPSRRTMASR